jgi:putative membrane protein
MSAFLMTYYLWLKALHLIGMVAWMAGMLYLPRLYVYHADAAPGSDKSETFKIMERRLLRAIINPAMIATILFGVLMLVANPQLMSYGWVHAKLGLIAALVFIHVLFAKWRKDFERDQNTRPAKFFRIWNEVPTVALVLIIILAVIRPF